MDFWLQAKRRILSKIAFNDLSILAMNKNFKKNPKLPANLNSRTKTFGNFLKGR